tara:strand:- start:162 stop:407 length:246 start_codon:yes stop_codon:yes gene_type:complete
VIRQNFKESNMNKEIVNLIEQRLEKGKREYGDQIDPNDGRNWEQEALEEVLDGMVYLATAILKIKNKKGIQNNIEQKHSTS